MRFAADDRDHQRETERTRAGERSRCSADAQPDRKRILYRAWINTLPVERRTMFARPVKFRIVADFEQKIELLLKNANRSRSSSDRRAGKPR